MFIVSFIALTLSLIVWMLSNEWFLSDNIYMIVPEIFAVCILMIIKIYKPHIRHYMYKNSTGGKIFFNDFLELATFTQYFFTLHIFVASVYEFLNDRLLPQSDDVYIFIGVPVTGIVAIMLYEHIKIKAIATKLKKEDWIPIVNERGEVTGKIAKSVTVQMKNKFLHPIVRVALVCNGKIYLQDREANDILDPGALDHPFEKYMLFKHEINLAVKNSIVRSLGKELPFRFLLKYTFENENTKRLIFLFASIIEDESEIEKLDSLHGRLWTTKQIENDLGDDSKFAECFQLEYEYLKNTVLAASAIRKEAVSTQPVSIPSACLSPV
ncbi:NUDIX hydrolase [Viscerimonas tarda]